MIFVLLNRKQLDLSLITKSATSMSFFFFSFLERSILVDNPMRKFFRLLFVDY